MLGKHWDEMSAMINCALTSDLGVVPCRLIPLEENEDGVDEHRDWLRFYWQLAPGDGRTN